MKRCLSRKSGFVLLAAFSLQACASHLIIADRPDGTGIGGEPYRVGQTSFAGERGASTDGATGHVAKECPGSALRSVEVHRNFFQGLATLVTLGIVSPATIRFTCDKTDIPEDPNSGSDTEF